MAANNEVYNKDELNPPEWLNESFFTNVLKSCESDKTIKIKSFKLTPGSLQGDHYASIMFRVRVDYETEKKSELQLMSMIIKTSPEVDSTKKEMLDGSYLFETEIGMYYDVIPKFESVLREAGDKTILGPRCLYSSLSPKKIIIFEDLVPLGYKTLQEVNLKGVKAAFLKLAKLHAVSYKILHKNPSYFDKYRHSITSLVNMIDGGVFTSGIENFIAMLDAQPTLRKYKPYFVAMQPDLHANYKATFDEYIKDRQKDAHYVLCHGDFHLKNMMFKLNAKDGHIDDVLLLDYQLSNVGPMVNDIIYSTYMLMNREMRKNHYDEILHFYFSNFTETLRVIKYKGKIPKLIEFRQMLLRHRHCEIFMMVSFLPYVIGYFAGNVDPDQMLTDKEYQKDVYHNKEYITELEERLPKLLHMGYLDN